MIVNSVNLVHVERAWNSLSTFPSSFLEELLHIPKDSIQVSTPEGPFYAALPPPPSHPSLYAV